MMTLSDEKRQFINSFLEEPLIARMATADASGQPHAVPVWYGWDGESIWISSYRNTRKVADLQQNPKISIVIDVAGDAGGTKAVIFEGAVSLVKEPRDLLRKQFIWIYTRYMGEEGVKAEDPQRWIEDPHNLLIKLTPATVTTWHW